MSQALPAPPQPVAVSGALPPRGNFAFQSRPRRRSPAVGGSRGRKAGAARLPRGKPAACLARSTSERWMRTPAGSLCPATRPAAQFPGRRPGRSDLSHAPRAGTRAKRRRLPACLPSRQRPRGALWLCRPPALPGTDPEGGRRPGPANPAPQPLRYRPSPPRKARATASVLLVPQGLLSPYPQPLPLRSAFSSCLEGRQADASAATGGRPQPKLATPLACREVAGRRRSREHVWSASRKPAHSGAWMVSRPPHQPQSPPGGLSPLL